MIDIRDETEFEHAQQRETNIDVLLEEYRASFSELFGSEPSPTPSATVLADDTEDGDAIDSESDTSGSNDDEPEPARAMAAKCRYLFGLFLSLANALAISLFARWHSADPITDSKGYVAHRGNLMADDDVMIVDCGATKHCIPDASKLSKVTDPNPRHAVKIGDGKRLDVS